MAWTEILRIPNLLSLSRVFLTPWVGYYLWRGDKHSALIALGLVLVAAVTDGLDGYLARRSHRDSELGRILDPLADKVFAGALVVFLVLYRGLPMWLAALIVGRDLLIAGGGLIMMRRHRVVNPSNLTGKYAFTAIASLLASYVARFDFGVSMTTWLVVVLTIASLIGYGRVFIAISRGRPAPVFYDRPPYRATRIIVSLIVITVFVYGLCAWWFPHQF
jgi:CDP-diacylglycerol--glycerol-3-phosphate 3-phosphatidyltransferase